MILSLAHKFVFVKGLKVAGTSVEMALAAICEPNDIVAPILPIDELERLRSGTACRNYALDRRFEPGYLSLLAKATGPELAVLRPPRQIYYNHMSLQEIERRYKRPLDDFRIVCAERSPYAKLISWLNMRERFAAYRTGGGMRGDPSRLQAAFDRLRERGNIGVVRNVERYYRSGADILKVEVLRYETLQEDFDAFVRGLGCPAVPLPHAKKGLMSDRLDPRAIFRRDQLDAINAVYDSEFEIFGYPRI